MDRTFDAFIAWRYVASVPIGASARRRFLWLHDLVPASAVPSARLLSSQVDAVWVQSAFHKQRFLAAISQPSLSSSDSDSGSDSDSDSLEGVHATSAAADLELGSKVVVVPNGVAGTEGCDGNNDLNTFVYGSAPNRGLEQLLKLWPRIRHIRSSLTDQLNSTTSPSASAGASLEVFYGFTDAVKQQLEKTFGPAYFAQWHAEMLELLDAGQRLHNVHYHGAVDHATLTAAFAGAGFLLYPTNFPETGCITLLKAMACGVFPITSRFASSVLQDVTRASADVDFDLGPRSALNDTLVQDASGYSRWLSSEWMGAVADAVKLSVEAPERLASLRVDMKKYARSKFSWHASAKIVQALLVT
jgi:glycosyltransferase involved in cell wall biosynthesis